MQPAKMRLGGTAWVTQEAAPGRWCDLSQRARDIRHRGPHTTRSWGFPWHLCPSCSPYSALSHSFPNRIRPAFCVVNVALTLEQFLLGVQHPGGWSSSLVRGVLGGCRRTPMWTDRHVFLKNKYLTFFKVDLTKGVLNFD